MLMSYPVSTIVLLLASYGVCFGLMNDKAKMLTDLLKRLPLFRDANGQTFFARMLVCPYCTGFHTGWMVWLAVMLPMVAADFDWWDLAEIIPDLALFAFASSAFCYAIDSVIQWFER